jgi:hypothetical protein
VRVCVRVCVCVYLSFPNPSLHPSLSPSPARFLQGCMSNDEGPDPTQGTEAHVDMEAVRDTCALRAVTDSDTSLTAYSTPSVSCHSPSSSSAASSSASSTGQPSTTADYEHPVSYIPRLAPLPRKVPYLPVPSLPPSLPPSQPPLPHFLSPSPAPYL